MEKDELCFRAIYLLFSLWEVTMLEIFFSRIEAKLLVLYKMHCFLVLPLFNDLDGKNVLSVLFKNN